MGYENAVDSRLPPQSDVLWHMLPQNWP